LADDGLRRRPRVGRRLLARVARTVDLARDARAASPPRDDDLFAGRPPEREPGPHGDAGHDAERELAGQEPPARARAHPRPFPFWPRRRWLCAGGDGVASEAGSSPGAASASSRAPSFAAAFVAGARRRGPTHASSTAGSTTT